MEQPLRSVIGGNRSLHLLSISLRVSNWMSVTTRVLRSAAFSSHHDREAVLFGSFRPAKQKRGARPVLMIQRICRSLKEDKGGNLSPFQMVRSNANKSGLVLRRDDIEINFDSVWKMPSEKWI